MSTLEVAEGTNMYQSVAFKLMQKCGDCGSNFPINGMVEQYDCAHCGREFEMDLRAWRQRFGDGFSRGAGRNGADGVDMTIIQQGTHYSFHSRQILPQCPECDAEVPVDGLEPESVDLPCPECDFLLPVRQATDLARGLQQRALYLVGEYGIKEHIRKLERTTEPVMFSCLQCGAGLSVDGSSRSVTCQYCDASNYLPEGLWRKLNPVPTAEYFYFILESRQARRERKRREKEQEEKRRQEQLRRDLEIANDPDGSIEEHRRLVDHEDRRIRQAVAAHITDLDSWQQLAGDFEDSVRVAALNNPHFKNTPQWLAAVDACAEDPSVPLRLLLAQNERTPPALHRRLYEDTNYSVSEAARMHLGLPKREDFSKVIDSGDNEDFWARQEVYTPKMVLLLVIAVISILVLGWLGLPRL